MWENILLGLGNNLQLSHLTVVAIGAFAEMAETRTDLVRMALGHACRAGWVRKHTRISLIGDHPNDVEAAKLNGIQAVAVCTGICPRTALTASRPDVLLPDLRSLRLDMLL